MDPLGGDGSGDGNVGRRGGYRDHGLWSSAKPQEAPLRRPHSSASGSTEPRKEQSISNISREELVQKSKLSVDAAVFIPKLYPVKQTMQQQPSAKGLPKPSVQTRLVAARNMSRQAEMQQTQTSGYNYDASQNYQDIEQIQQFDNFSQQQQVEQSIGVQDYGNYDGGSGDYRDKHQESSEDEDNLIEFAHVIQDLITVIRSLILNPGRFTSTVPPLINNLLPYLEFPTRFQEILKIIIQQSIVEDNFRYSGARLCAFLDSAMTPVEQMSFREILYMLCKEETESQASRWKLKDDHSDEEQKKCHGLILFLAEVVTQMEHTSAFGLGDLLIQLIIVILKKPALNSVKNICQALKLAGHTLEKDKTGSRKDMENMMRSLTELVTSGRVNSHEGRMVHSVHELRNGNWGQTSSIDPVVEFSTQVDANHALDEPVFYGPDGKVLTAEENKFLEDIADSTPNMENHVILADDYKEEKWPQEEEDDEMDAAYEEFLKQPNTIKNQAQK